MAQIPTITYRVVNPKTGVVQDVADGAVHGLTGSGWLLVGQSGTTAQRPITGLANGTRYFDKTLNKIILWVGGGGGVVHHAAGEPGFWTDGTGATV